MNEYLDFRIPDTFDQPITLRHLLDDAWFLREEQPRAADRGALGRHAVVLLFVLAAAVFVAQLHHWNLLGPRISVRGDLPLKKCSNRHDWPCITTELTTDLITGGDDGEAMKLIAKRHGQPTGTSHAHDYTDWQAVDAFAREFAGSVEARRKS